MQEEELWKKSLQKSHAILSSTLTEDLWSLNSASILLPGTRTANFSGTGLQPRTSFSQSLRKTIHLHVLSTEALKKYFHNIQIETNFSNSVLYLPLAYGLTQFLASSQNSMDLSVNDLQRSKMQKGVVKFNYSRNNSWAESKCVGEANMGEQQKQRGRGMGRQELQTKTC